MRLLVQLIEQINDDDDDDDDDDMLNNTVCTKTAFYKLTYRVTVT